MKFIKGFYIEIFLLVYLFSSYGQDLGKENIYINSVNKSENVDKIKRIQDEYYKRNRKQINSFVDDLKSNVNRSSVKNSYEIYKIDDTSKYKGKMIIDSMKKDENLQRWIKEFTKDIYYKELYSGKSYSDNKIEDLLLENYNKIISGKSFAVGLVDTVLDQDERIYIFLSSSVPISIWKNYIKSIRLVGSNNIYIVLRGCIGKEGCKKFMPTVNFVRKVAFEGVGMDTSKPANIIIDPYLFRYYKVKVVPTIVYARGVSLVNMGSEGFEGNLKKKVSDFYKIEGDVSIFYFVDKLVNDFNLNSEGLKKIVDIGVGF